MGHDHARGLSDLEGDVLAHLHANDSLDAATIAQMIGVDEPDIARTIADLLAAGHLQREGVRLVPDAASHPTPGVFVASERGDAGSLEVPYGEDER